jgi:hypothetical protein
MIRNCILVTCLLATFYTAGMCQSWPKVPITDVTVQLTPTTMDGQLHWRISNGSKSSVFVYSFFLYGPALGREHRNEKEVFDTTPTSLDKGTVYHFPPVLLLMVPAGDYREGDFRDPELREVMGRSVSLKIGVGSDPYSVVDEAKRLRQSKKSTDNPYNAIFEWSTIIESNVVQLPETAPSGTSANVLGDTLAGGPGPRN